MNSTEEILEEVERSAANKNGLVVARALEMHERPPLLLCAHCFSLYRNGSKCDCSEAIVVIGDDPLENLFSEFENCPRDLVISIFEELSGYSDSDRIGLTKIKLMKYMRDEARLRFSETMRLGTDGSPVPTCVKCKVESVEAGGQICWRCKSKNWNVDFYE